MDGSPLIAHRSTESQWNTPPETNTTGKGTSTLSTNGKLSEFCCRCHIAPPHPTRRQRSTWTHKFKIGPKTGHRPGDKGARSSTSFHLHLQAAGSYSCFLLGAWRIPVSRLNLEIVLTDRLFAACPVPFGSSLSREERKEGRREASDFGVSHSSSRNLRVRLISD